MDPLRHGEEDGKVMMSKKEIYHSQQSSSNHLNTIRPHNPLRTFEEYVKALMWMMQRLLGLKKMTNRIKRTSTVKITLIASFFWIVIFLQIKIDSKKGRLFFKSLQVLSCVLSVLAGIGATSMLIFKIHKSFTEGDANKKAFL